MIVLLSISFMFGVLLTFMMQKIYKEWGKILDVQNVESFIQK
jgi:hypothetical protein